MDKIQVSIQGKSYSVIGSEFGEMLSAVKSLPGRQFTATKVWQLSQSLEEARTALAPLQVLDEDGLLEAEIADIQRVQQRLLELQSQIEARMSSLSGEIKRYSFRSKSRIRASLVQEYGRLDHALADAKLPVEQLTEPQIKTMYAALRDMEREGE